MQKPETTGKETGNGIHLDRLSVEAKPASEPQWGSDVVAEMLRVLGVEYVALNPGSSFRGLHDSLVNYNDNERPGIILCNHEEVAVSIAHGYARLRGSSMAAIVHSNVGLMHASMAIFNAWANRKPVLVLGATGPMDAKERRPWIDWMHTSYAQGELVRDFTKWEHQPSSVEAIPEALLRAWQTVHTRPQGPVYVCFDATLQEQKLDPGMPIPTAGDVRRYQSPEPPAPSPKAVEQAASWLVEADNPVILLGDAGQSEQAWDALVELAETLGAAVLTDMRDAACFPTEHPLLQAGPSSKPDDELCEVLQGADAVLSLERLDLAGTLKTAFTNNSGNSYLSFGAGEPPFKLINVSLNHYALRSWTQDFQELPPADLFINAGTEPTVSALLEKIRSLVSGDTAAQSRVSERTKTHGARRARLEEKWEKARQTKWNDAPISLARLVGELREALGDKHSGAILAAAPLRWPKGIWEFIRHDSYLGKDGGGGIGSGPGLAVGAGLAALKDERLVIGVLGDGDLLMAPTALWTAAHHNIPLLFVVANNNTYLNDEEHQKVMAEVRDRPVENRWIGQRMDEPPVDFAGLARDMGVTGFGPITDPSDLAEAYKRALAVVTGGRRPALVDVRIASDK